MHAFLFIFTALIITTASGELQRPSDVQAEQVSDGVPAIAGDGMSAGQAICYTPPPNLPKAFKPLTPKEILSLPLEQRPILKFDELSFSDVRIEQQARDFQSLAEGIAQRGWKVQLYKDARHSANPRYVASWRSTSEEQTKVIPSLRPFRGMTIELTGKSIDGADELDMLSVTGRAVPLQGWAAMVNYELRIGLDGKPIPALYAFVMPAREREAFRFDVYDSQLLRLPCRHVDVGVNNLRFQTQLPVPEYEHLRRMLYGTPETLRDGSLANIDALRKHAQEQLDMGKGLTMYNMSEVRSDSPPYARPVNSIDDVTKKLLWTKVESILSSHEESIRKHFSEIHAAVQQALPAEKLLNAEAASREK